MTRIRIPPSKPLFLGVHGVLLRGATAGHPGPRTQHDALTTAHVKIKWRSFHKAKLFYELECSLFTHLLTQSLALLRRRSDFQFLENIA